MGERMGKAEALHQAKLDTMEKYPSPYHWAAFVLTGEMGEIASVSSATSTPSEISPSATSESSSHPGLPCSATLLPLIAIAVNSWLQRQKGYSKVADL